MKIIVLFMASAAWMMAGDPEGFGQWTSAELKEAAKKLAPKMNESKIATEVLASWGNHNLMLVHREASGQAEWHETQADVFIVQSGEGTLVVGGTVVDPQNVSPHEVRGASIQGGETKRLSPGDIVHIPAKTAHQVMVPQGKHITYEVVKVDTP